MENTIDGQTDSHSDYSAQLRVVHMAIPNLQNIVVIDNIDLQFFHFNINCVIFGTFKSRHRF